MGLAVGEAGVIEDDDDPEWMRLGAGFMVGLLLGASATTALLWRYVQSHSVASNCGDAALLCGRAEKACVKGKQQP